MSKLVYDSFDAYVQDYPEGERFRKWLCGWRIPAGALGVKSQHKEKRGVYTRDVVILKTSPNWCGLPGDYLWACVSAFQNRFTVSVRDSDDMLAQRDFATEAEAIQQVEELKQLAPFLIIDLTHFGFTY